MPPKSNRINMKQAEKKLGIDKDNLQYKLLQSVKKPTKEEKAKYTPLYAGQVQADLIASYLTFLFGGCDAISLSTYLVLKWTATNGSIKVLASFHTFVTKKERNRKRKKKKEYLLFLECKKHPCVVSW